MVNLRKRRMRIIATVPVRQHDEDGGEIVCEAHMELTRSGSVIAHIDMSEMTPDLLFRGFKLGEFKMPDEDGGHRAAQGLEID